MTGYKKLKIAPSSGNVFRDLGVCLSNAILLRRTIRDHLRRSRPEKILTVFE